MRLSCTADKVGAGGSLMNNLAERRHLVSTLYSFLCLLHQHIFSLKFLNKSESGLPNRYLASYLTMHINTYLQIK